MKGGGGHGSVRKAGRCKLCFFFNFARLKRTKSNFLKVPTLPIYLLHTVGTVYHKIILAFFLPVYSYI